MNKYFATRNVQHLNQVQDLPFTIELLKSLIRTNIFTTFSGELLAGKLNFNYLNITSTI